MNNIAEAILAWGIDIGHECKMSEATLEVIDDLDSDTDRPHPPGINILGYNRHSRRPGSGRRIVAYAPLVFSAWNDKATKLRLDGVPPDAQATLDAGMRALGLEPMPGVWLLTVFCG